MWPKPANSVIGAVICLVQLRRVRTKIGSGALSVVTVVISVEEDAMAQEGESGSAVHVAHDAFGFGVDAFRTAAEG
jgi:hypothetical protein